MKKLIFILLFLGSATLCPGQNTVLHKWTEGLKDWSGYQIVEPSREEPSFTSFTLYKEKKNFRRDGIIYSYIDVTAAFEPQKSWVRSNAMTEAELSAVRRDFDLLEFFALQYRDTLLTTQDKDGSLMIEYNRKFEEARERVRKGADLSAYPLPATPFDVTQLAWARSDRSGGMSMALCTRVPVGSLTRLISPAIGINFGFERRWGRNALLLDGTVGIHFLTNRYSDITGAWNNQHQTPSFAVSAGYGRELFSTEELRLSVHAGPAFGGYLFSTNGAMGVLAGGPGLSEGLCLDYVVSRNISFSGRSPEYSDTSIRVRLYSDQIWILGQNYLLPTINLSAGIHFDSRLLIRQ